MWDVVLFLFYKAEKNMVDKAQEVEAPLPRAPSAKLKQSSA